MNVKVTALLLHSMPYRIEDEKTGEINSGVSIRYLLADSLEPVVDGQAKGIRPSKDAIDSMLACKITQVPAMYEFDCAMIPDSSGATKLKIKDLKFSHLMTMQPLTAANDKPVK